MFLASQHALHCAGPLPAWHDKLSPEMEGVLRAVRKVAGDCLDAPEMSLFQPLLGSLSPDALLAVGKHHALCIPMTADTAVLIPTKEGIRFNCESSRHSMLRSYLCLKPG